MCSADTTLSPEVCIDSHVYQHNSISKCVTLYQLKVVRYNNQADLHWLILTWNRQRTLTVKCCLTLKGFSFISITISIIDCHSRHQNYEAKCETTQTKFFDDLQ